MRQNQTYPKIKLLWSYFLRLGFLSSFILCAFVIFMGCTNSQESDRKKLVLGLSADYPPFEFRESGKIVGYDVDLAQALAQEMGFELVVQDLDFSSLIPSLESGRLDFVMSGMTATEERKKNIAFSRSYYKSKFAIILRSETSFSPDEGFGQMKIGAQLGSTTEKYARDQQSKNSPEMKVMPLGRYAVLIQELKNKRVDGVIAEEAQGYSFVKANPTLKWVRLPALENSESNAGYSIAFSKKKTEQISRFNQALQKLEAEGVMQKLQLKWLGNGS